MSVDEVQSPCVRQCCLNEDDICVGCWRSIDEILRWSAATNEERKEIIQCVAERKDKKER